MLKEIAYWTYRFFSNTKRCKKEGGAISDSVMFVSACLFWNVLSAIYIVEYYTQLVILKHIPITTRRELSSWIFAALIILPFIWFVYVRYFKPPKLSNLMDEYAIKSKKRLLLGRIFYFAYCVFSWIGSFVIVAYFKH